MCVLGKKDIIAVISVLKSGGKIISKNVVNND